MPSLSSCGKLKQDEVIDLWPQEQAVQHHLIIHQFITINQPTHLIFATWNKANLAGSAGINWRLWFNKIPAMCNIKPVTQNNTLKIVKQALDGNYVAIKCSQMDQLDTFGEKNNI